jgi:hypothetical protein
VRVRERPVPSFSSALFNRTYSILPLLHSFYSNNLSGKGAAAIAAGLTHNRTLTDLREEPVPSFSSALFTRTYLILPPLLHSFVRNSIGDEGATAIAEALRHNKTLTWLG